MVQSKENEDQVIAAEKEPVYSMDRLSEAFESSARRWELIVYPSLFAFIILAAYGFFLVYSLASCEVTRYESDGTRSFH